jgi:hypothetical protein
LAEASTRHGTRSRVTAPRANTVRNELRSSPCRSAGANASSKPRKRPKPRSRRRSHPVGSHRPKPEASARVPSSFEQRDASPRRSGTRSCRLEGCLPPESHRGGARAQDTQREFDDISHGARLLSTYEPRRSLCRFASSTPSALGVSHSLSGLIPPGPRGFVSRHIRP